MKRIRRRLTRFGLPMLQLDSRAANATIHRRREAHVDALIADAQIDALRALQEGTLTIEIVDDFARNNPLTGGGLVAHMQLNKPLWSTLVLITPTMTKGAQSATRYDITRKKLERVLRDNKENAHLLPSDPRINDLRTLDWSAIRVAWGGSASDWNHLRRYISALLSKLLGDSHHPARRQIVTRIPLAPEAARVTDCTPELFHAIIANAREDVRPVYWTLVLTGMRVSEYLRCDESNLHAHTRQVSVPGTKTTSSANSVSIDEEFWPWVVAGIPAPHRYRHLMRLWIEAQDATPECTHRVTLHDLRHCHGQWATNANVRESAVQSSLRHQSPAMTRRYTTQKDRGDVARGLAEQLRTPSEANA